MNNYNFPENCSYSQNVQLQKEDLRDDRKFTHHYKLQYNFTTADICIKVATLGNILARWVLFI